MPYGRTSRYKKSKRAKRSIRQRRVNPRVYRAMMFNPAPIFTETYKLSSNFNPNSGGALGFNMDSIPQLAQYQNLYQKYRILRATLILLPQYYGQDENAAEYNGGNNVFAAGLGRFVHAINDSPNLQAPANEDAVLVDNGCKIRMVKTGLRVTCKPVPNAKDANGIQMTFKNKYINLLTTGNITHYGITWWYSQPTLGTTASVNNDLHAYIKLTFQLADPR